MLPLWNALNGPERIHDIFFDDRREVRRHVSYISIAVLAKGGKPKRGAFEYLFFSNMDETLE
jgi:hypothetical protein